MKIPRTCVIGRRAGLGAFAFLALSVPAASAHTSALCAVTGRNVTCAGTIGDRPLMRAPSRAQLTVHDGYGSIRLRVGSIISRSAAPALIEARLVCAEQSSGLVCIGIAKVGRERVLVTTTGRPNHGTVVIELSHAVAPTSTKGD